MYRFPQSLGTSACKFSEGLIRTCYTSPLQGESLADCIPAFFYFGETMTRSTCWSLALASLALVSYLMNRDISSNIFLASFFIVQAVKPADETRLNQSAMALCAVFGTAIVGFAICAWVFGLEWSRPVSW